jgi:hypothetical protein
MVKPKTTISGRLGNSSGAWIRTKDLRVMSHKPESVLFVRRALHFSQTGERWFLLARHAAIPQGDDVVDRCAYSSLFTRVRQVFFADFLKQLLRKAAWYRLSQGENDHPDYSLTAFGRVFCVPNEPKDTMPLFFWGKLILSANIAL